MADTQEPSEEPSAVAVVSGEVPSEQRVCLWLRCGDRAGGCGVAGEETVADTVWGFFLSHTMYAGQG